MAMLLVVEDDAAIRNNIVRLLALEGFDTLAASDAQADDDLSKPFTRTELPDAVDAQIRKKTRVEERINFGLTGLADN